MMTADQALVAMLDQGTVSRWEGLEAGELLDRANYHGVATLLQGNSSEGLAWPEEFTSLLTARARHAAANECLLQEELQRCLRAFAEADTKVLLTKGVLLAYTLYACPSYRSRCDSDIFIPESQKVRVFQVLENLGYVRYNSTPGDLVNRQAIFTRKIGHGLSHCFDVHWHLFNRHTLNHVLLHDLCWSRRIAIPALGEQANGLNPVHALLHACLHRLAHHGEEGDRLIWLYDLILLARTLDADQRSELVDLCEAYGLAEACARSLADVQALWPRGETELLLASLEAKRSEVQIPAGNIMYKNQIDTLKQDLGALPLVQRLRLLRQHLFPAKEYIIARYDVTSHWLLPWVYLTRLWRGAAREFWPKRGT